MFGHPCDTAQHTGKLLNHNVERERMHVNLHRTDLHALRYDLIAFLYAVLYHMDH